MHRINLAALLLAAAVCLAAPSALAATSTVVVSQVYAGGGNAGATYQNDFVELFNRGGSAVDLTGWTVQYASATSTSWPTTPLSGSIAPGRHYLVQLASTATVGATLPAPEATGTSNLAASGGKVALVRDATALACGATAGSCSSAALLEDLVGYGSATDYEGAGAGACAHEHDRGRCAQGGGCTDTDANAADFASAAPTPRNGSAAAGVLLGNARPSSTTAARGRRRGAGAVPLRRARALEHQLRPGVRRADAAFGLRARDGREQQQRAATCSPSIAPRSRRPTCRSASRRRRPPRSRRSRWLRRPTSCSRARPPRRLRRATSGPRASASRVPLPVVCRRAATRRRSRSR